MNQGKVAESALKRSVLKAVNQYNKNEWAQVGSDATTIGRLTASSACICGESPKLAAIAIIRTVNSIACAGGVCESVSLSLAVPQDNPVTGEAEQVIKNCIDEAIRACGLCRVNLITGNTVITDGTKLTVSVTGMGHNQIPLKEPNRDKERILLMLGNTAVAGTCLLTEKHYELLAGRLIPDFVKQACVPQEKLFMKDAALALATAVDGVAAMHDVEDGGVFGAIWELCEREKCGCLVDAKAIPIKQAVIEVCEILDVNPYQMLGDGAVLAILEDTPENRTYGKVIGHITKTNDRILLNGEEKRFLEPNRVDSFYLVK